MKSKENLALCGHEAEGDCRFRHNGGCVSLTYTKFPDGFCHFRKEPPKYDGDEGVNAYDATKAKFAGIIGMTLREALSELKSEPGYAYIGSQTSFLVIETAKDAIAPVCIASAKLTDEAKRTEDRAKARLDNLVKLAAKIKASDEAACWHLANNLREQLAQTQYMYEARIYILQYVPLMDRKIIDAYPRITGGYALIVEGTEVGKYSSRKEYEADLKQTKNPG